MVLVGFGLRESGVGAAGSCFKLSFPEMFEGTSRVLSVPVTLKWWRWREGQDSSYLDRHSAINGQAVLS